MWQKQVINVIGLILLSLLFLEFIYGPLIHETAHSFACFISGNDPEQSWMNVKCIGIEKEENSTRLEIFLYFMMPYIADLMILIFILFYLDKSKYVKFFVFVPFFDLIINFASSGLGHSDFLYADFSIRSMILLLGIIFIGLVIAVGKIIKSGKY